MAKTRKPSNELLLPAERGWERWSGHEGEPGVLVSEGGENAGAFGKDVQQRVLALPASHAWVLPAWLNGDSTHLADMAALHLERLGVRVADAARELHVARIAEREGAHLTRIIALKDQASPLSDFSRLPDEVLLNAQCYPIPANSIVLFRELSRLVVAITHGDALIYCSPLSATRLDAQALGELNHLCVQLGFQGVLGRVEGIVVWMEEGDLGQIQLITGLPASRETRPAPIMPRRGQSPLVPLDILQARAQQVSRTKTRMLALTVGFALAAAVAVIAALTSLAVQERNTLRERVAELSPKSSRVLDQKKSWLEAAPAVDPSTFAMQALLHAMEPSASGEVSMTHFEWTPERLILRGRTPTPALALQYANEITAIEGLAYLTWDTPAPTIASDNSATFELKGAREP